MSRTQYFSPILVSRQVWASMGRAARHSIPAKSKESVNSKRKNIRAYFCSENVFEIDLQKNVHNFIFDPHYLGERSIPLKGT